MNVLSRSPDQNNHKALCKTRRAFYVAHQSQANFLGRGNEPMIVFDKNDTLIHGNKAKSYDIAYRVYYCMKVHAYLVPRKS